MYCSKCGAQNDVTAVRCAQCGNPLQPVPPPPPSIAQSYQQDAAGRPQVPNHLVPAILVTLLCCLPLGIVAIVFAARVNTKLAAGDVPGAIADSNRAKIWSLLALVLGVVPAILILAAIAIPNLLRARIAANEASAVGSVRTVNTAESAYRSAFSTVGYACDLRQLGGNGASHDSTNAGLIDDVLATGRKSGYQFQITTCMNSGDNSTYQVVASPLQPGTTGTRTFCSDQTGVIRYLKNGSGDQCVENGSPIR